MQKLFPAPIFSSDVTILSFLRNCDKQPYYIECKFVSSKSINIVLRFMLFYYI